MIGIRATLFSTLVLIAAAASVRSADAQDAKPPTDPKALAAFQILDKACARCHEVEKLKNRPVAAAGFGNVLRFDEIVDDPRRVVPGNPDASPILTRILSEEMPADYQNIPTKDEIAVLRDWISGLKENTANACSSRKLVSNRDVVRSIAADLDKQIPARKRDTRYLTLTNLYNACVPDATLSIYRQGAVKMVNSLARLSNVVRLETIDSAGTILRINIDELGWKASDWEALLSVYPYAMRPADTSLNAAIESTTGTKLAYVRADWFAFTTSRAPLYNRLLNLPRTFAELQRQQRVDVTANLDHRRPVAKRAGFQLSGVSENNRLIERHPSPIGSGYFWTSYDFAGNAGRKNLFEFPLGPGGEFGFQHDGGETIFSLPNGFQAYYLNDAKGAALDKGPINVVRDSTHQGRDPSVVNGISCISCHKEGMNMKQDEIRKFTSEGRAAFPKFVRDAIEALHPLPEEMNRLLEDDKRRFKDAMARAGIKDFQDRNGVEIVAALARRYEDNLDLKAAAAEFGMTPDQFKDAVLSSADGVDRQLVRRLVQSAVARDQFERDFGRIARRITDDELVRARFNEPRIAPTRVTSTDVDLSLTSDSSTYQAGDKAVFTVTASRDCFLTLTDVDSKGQGTVLLPNRFRQNNRIRAGEDVQIPGPGDRFEFAMKDRGTETIIAVCSERNREVDGIKHDFTRSAFTAVDNYSATVSKAYETTRSIRVTEAAQPAAQQPRPAAPAAPSGRTFRTSIKVQVR
jgi:hypothetical protein